MAKRTATTKRNVLCWSGDMEPTPRRGRPAASKKNAGGRMKTASAKLKRALAQMRGKRKRNPDAEEAAARKLAASFHGRQVQKVMEVDETFLQRTDLADLGKLMKLVALDSYDEEQAYTLDFTTTNIRVACTGEGGQIYFVGGDQELDLKRLGVDAQGKDYVVIGDVWKITYHTKKDFHNFEPTNYEHEFGEEGGYLPVLAYDTQSKKMLGLIGGSYVVKRPGIIN